MNSVLPDSIKIAGHDIEVIERDKEWLHSKDKWGHYNSAKARMKVVIECTDTRILETFLHEMLHGVFDCYGIYTVDDKDVEEEVITLLSKGLTQVLRDNPELMSTILVLTGQVDSGFNTPKIGGSD